MITGLNHTSFTVPNVEKAVQFWTQLGFECPGIVERRGAWVGQVTGVPCATIRVAHLYGHGGHLEFIEYANAEKAIPSSLPNKPGVGHICLNVQDINGTAATLFAAGASALGEMTDIIDPALPRCSAGYLRDPNGIIIELLEVPDSGSGQH